MKSTINGAYPKIGGQPDLRKAIHQFEKGQIGKEELEEIQRETIRRVIKEQEEAGIDLVGDGLIRFEDMFSSLVESWQGIQRKGLKRFFDNNTYYRQPVIEGEIVYFPSPYIEDVKFAFSVATKPLKAILPGPFTFSKLSENKFYPTQERLISALTSALLEEARQIEGYVQAIQFDEPSLPLFPAEIEKVKEEFERIRKGLKKKILLSIYFSPLKGSLPSLADFPVDGLVLDLLTEENLQSLLDFLREKGYKKEIGLGCIDARNTRLEKKEEVKDIVAQIKDYFSGDLYLTPNCSLEFLPHSVVLSKIRNMVEIARRC
ncbi:MAG: hypothetical protein DRP75_01400 [Candidatus Omnitrophota bacterium]|nr:MAG: hypothetical protein DRP75_01400 [Candidatus Omnitrophota bacterium]